MADLEAIRGVVAVMLPVPDGDVLVCCSAPGYSGRSGGAGGSGVADSVAHFLLPLGVRPGAWSVCRLPPLGHPLLHTFW